MPLSRKELRPGDSVRAVLASIQTLGACRGPQGPPLSQQWVPQLFRAGGSNGCRIPRAIPPRPLATPTCRVLPEASENPKHHSKLAFLEAKRWIKRPLCPFLLRNSTKGAGGEEPVLGGRQPGPPALQCPLAPGKSRQRGLAERPPSTAQWGWGQPLALEYCHTHWGFPSRFLGPSLWGLAENSARTRSRLGPEPWTRRAAGPSSRHAARSVQSKRRSWEGQPRAQLRQEALCPYQGED